jgi:replicative DNA helicase
MIKCVPLLEDASFEKVENIISDALKAGTYVDMGQEYIEDFELRYAQRDIKAVPTGWKEMDKIMHNGFGLGIGELGVVAAPPGRGKSHVLVALGANAIVHKKNVVHITLELSEDVTGLRYDSNITNIPMDEILLHKDKVGETLRSHKLGKLYIKYFSPKKVSTLGIKNYLEKLRQHGVKVELLIVDYADRIKPIQKEREKRHELETIYEELRDLGGEYDFPVRTASQINRSGANEDVIEMESVAEAYAKANPVDFFFTLSRKQVDKENNTGRFYVAKSRLGMDGVVFPIEIDTSRSKLKVLPRIMESIESIVAGGEEVSLQRKSEKLKQAFKNWQEEGVYNASGSAN